MALLNRQFVRFLFLHGQEDRRDGGHARHGRADKTTRRSHILCARRCGIGRRLFLICGLLDQTLHGSAVVRLALAGATVPEIATITGHSLKDVESILDTHYLGRDVKPAESAVRKLER